MAYDRRGSSFLPALLAVLLTVASPSPSAETPLVIDVRTVEEYAEGHLQGALNMPHQNIATLITAAGVDKDTPIQLYCKSGRRAAIAEDSLRTLGYQHVDNLGGYEALAEERQQSCSDNC